MHKILKICVQNGNSYAIEIPDEGHRARGEGPVLELPIYRHRLIPLRIHSGLKTLDAEGTTFRKGGCCSHYEDNPLLFKKYTIHGRVKDHPGFLVTDRLDEDHKKI